MGDSAPAPAPARMGRPVTHVPFQFRTPAFDLILEYCMYMGRHWNSAGIHLKVQGKTAASRVAPYGTVRLALARRGFTWQPRPPAQPSAA